MGGDSVEAGAAAAENNGSGPTDSGSQRRRSSRRRGGDGPPGMDDFRRLSRSGDSLYQLLEIPKTSTHQDIKKRYRRLALKYHPDKNPNNPEAEEMFKKVSHAHTILTDESKREIYDKYGSAGLHLAEQVGDEMVGTIMKFSSPWVQCLLVGIFCLSGCCCGCCCCCCCCFNFCCGKCAPELKDMEDIPDVAEFEDEEDDDVVTEQPGTGGVGANATAPSSDEQKPTEKSPLKTDSKNKYAAGDEPPPYEESPKS